MMFSYYPGCSSHSTAKTYDTSAREVCTVLGIELHELSEWNCCGASTAQSTDSRLSTLLCLRNLKLAEQTGRDLTTICAFCFNRLKNAQSMLKANPSLIDLFEDITGLKYEESVKVRHILELIFNDIGIDNIKNKVRTPLHGLKAVIYYGCFLVRPPEITGFDDPEYPLTMDTLMAAIGVEPLSWSYKTECCGGSLSITKREIVSPLVNTISIMAVEAGANCIVTACPLCFTNIETRTGSANRIPVFYFTELLGLAFGIEGSRKWFKRHLISPEKLLRSLKLI